MASLSLRKVVPTFTSNLKQLSCRCLTSSTLSSASSYSSSYSSSFFSFSSFSSSSSPSSSSSSLAPSSASLYPSHTHSRAFSVFSAPGPYCDLQIDRTRDSFPIGTAMDSALQPVTLITGEGIGRETAHSIVSIFEAADVPIEFDILDKFDVNKTPVNSIPVEVLNSFRKSHVAIKGPFQTPIRHPTMSFNIALRTQLDLYANVVHVFNLPGLNTRHKNVDCVVIRENTEGEYSGLEHEVAPGIVESLKIISEKKSLRIAEYAFKYAERNGRKKVTAVHKANIMKLGDGLFLECCKHVAQSYPNIQFEQMIVDNTCMQLTSKPQQFDVMVMPNLYGNIVTNLATGLVGGPGLFPGMNVGDHGAVFEQGARHAASAIAGKNIANPTGTILSAVMMLRYLKMNKYANIIDRAVMQVYSDGKFRTPDVGGSCTTTEFTNAVIARIEEP